MTITENLLFQLSEECNEVGQRASKAARFGQEEIQDGQELTNVERIVYEFSDLVAVMEVLRDRGVFKEIIDRDAVIANEK